MHENIICLDNIILFIWGVCVNLYTLLHVIKEISEHIYLKKPCEVLYLKVKMLEAAVLSFIKIFMKQKSASGIVWFCRTSLICILASIYG